MEASSESARLVLLELPTHRRGGGSALGAVQMIAVFLDAGRDKNGNPRRGWLIVDVQGNSVDWVEYGYEGTGALRRLYPVIPETERISVPLKEYRRVKKLSRFPRPARKLR